MFDNKAGDVRISQKYMADRRRNPEYKNLSGYLPIELISQVKEIAHTRNITQSEALEQALIAWVAEANSPPKDIYELVAQNLGTLKESGIAPTNLTAIARKEVMPTPVDFCKIVGILKLEEEEQKRLWNRTYNLGEKKSDCKSTTKST